MSGSIFFSPTICGGLQAKEPTEKKTQIVGQVFHHLLSLLLPSQGILLSSWYEAHWDVVHSALEEHHQRVGLLRVETGALPHHERTVLKHRSLHSQIRRLAATQEIEMLPVLRDCALTLFERDKRSSAVFRSHAPAYQDLLWMCAS